MHDPKFEQEVQQKMAELEFGPSESVWANIEAAVNRRRRRRAGMFWRFALPGLLLVAGGAYYFLREAPATTSPTAVVNRPAAAHSTGTTPESAATPARGNASDPNSVASAPNNDALNSNKVAATPNGIASNPNNVSLTPNSTTSNTNKTSSHSNNSTLNQNRTPNPNKITPNGANATGNSTNSATTGRPREGSAVAATLAKRGAGASRTHSPDPFTAAAKTGNAGSADDDDNRVSDVVAAATATGNNAASRNATFNPALASLHSGMNPVRAGKLESRTTTSTVQTLSKSHNPWEAGFAGGVGLSSLHQMKLANYGLNQSDLPSSLTTANAITTYAARPTKEYVSTVDPGPAFWLGILAQKRLGPRWNFSVGLDFHYYSNRVHVGQQVSGYTPSNATYLNAMAVAPIQSYPYYSRGDDQAYMNRYYFLELPVAIEWRINRSHLLPLFLDGGVSASYLVGSSAVYYNTHSGVYFKDAGVANRAQFNLNTALMVELPMQKIHVLVGPQIQYGLTPLLNTDVSGPQHIFYGGIRLVVMPGKK